MDVIHPTILVLIFVTYHNIEGNFLVLITLQSLVCFRILPSLSLSSFSESAFKLNFSSNQASLLISMFQHLHCWKYPLYILQYLFFGQNSSSPHPPHHRRKCLFQLHLVNSLPLQKHLLRHWLDFQFLINTWNISEPKISKHLKQKIDYLYFTDGPHS